MTGQASLLRALHRPGAPVVLPNVWDAASARVVETAGFAAIATSSAAVAEALGYADGEATPVGEMFDAVTRIVAAVRVPVTADLERGYGLGPGELVERLAASGAVGCNLEDSDPGTGTLLDAAGQADFLAAVREAARRAGVDLVINARIDTFLHGPGDPQDQLADSVRRARCYLDAGADCVFPILVAGRPAIRELVHETGGMVNILFRTGPPPTSSLADLAELGVARVSFGPGLHRAGHEHLAAMVATIKVGGDPYTQPT
ncbi:MAG: isocitrate lyase/phosphoenolpyruvate mutase family protein [Actinobacteria bacterium]|nr:isocitrate lyase/phosphoenolpyruvate mutase family protein [Actinomycetota bacterium]MBI3686950.1 isocitrate lyase/phosphoenolpyruvate mutase family protein [Actinomycetota bacterium]